MRQGSTNDLASEFRQQLGLGSGRLNVFEVLNRLCKLMPGLTYRTVPDENMPDVEAKYQSSDRTIVFRSSTLSALKAQQPRANFVGMEEMLHAWLGHTGVRNRSSIKQIHEKTNPAVRRMESQAKSVAREVLAPISEVSNDWTATQIASHFNISFQAAQITRELADKEMRVATRTLRSLPESVTKMLREAKERGIKIITPLDDIEPRRRAQSVANPRSYANPMVGQCTICGKPATTKNVSFRCDECTANPNRLADGDPRHS